MNKNIQPEFKDTVITCASCGAEFETASVKDGIKVDVCSNCHPYWSKNQKKTTRGGRADKFREKYNL